MAPGIRLSILSHPDPLRVGAICLLEGLEGGQVLLGRDSPEFRAGRSGPLLPIGDRYVSRRSCWLRWVGDSLELTPVHGASPVRLAGRTLAAPVRVAGERLSRNGIQLDLAGRLLLHLDRVEGESEDDLGFVGVTGGARDVRRSIRAYARLDVPLLVVGEPGCGKSLVAQLLHRHGPRNEAPFVVLGNLPADGRGPTVLDDAMRSAAGGTLVLDRIGEWEGDSQRHLLEYLETPPAGAREPRLVVTSDRDPDELVDRGEVGRPLLDRLQVGLLYVPPLRKRRPDLVLLFQRFLAEELAAVGAGGAMLPARDRDAAWIPLDLIYEILEHPFPGNARELRNVCTQIAVHSVGLDRAQIPPATRERLRRFSALQDTDEPSEERTLSKVGAPQLAAPRVRAVLAAQRWNLASTARALGVARNTLVSFMERTPGFRRVKDVPEAELRAAIDRIGSDPDALAAELEVSPHGLRIRLSTLD